MPSAEGPVTSTPDVPGQPYDATSEGAVGRWVSVDPNSGPADLHGNAVGDFPDGSGWSQT